MKIGIETKYNIGDEVWVWSETDDAPMRAKIMSISWKYKIDAYYNCVYESEELLYDVAYDCRTLKNCEEHKLFKTLEELYQHEVKKLEDKFNRLKYFNTETPDLKEKE